MTDAEIVKALECHNTCNLSSCRECPLYDTGECSVELCGYALDLITRQKAQLENQSENFKRLVAEHRKLQTDYSSMQSTLAKMSMGVAETRNEAIKEFAERLKKTFPQDDFLRSTKRISEDIDNLVKEMVGDAE